MHGAIGIAVLWFLFAGSHVGLAVRSVRSRLVAALGERGFLALFSGAAAIGFSALVVYYARHRFGGVAGLGLATSPWRLPLMAVAFIGVVLMFAMDYVKSPTALFDQPIRGPRGLERITRHPFFAGVTLLAVAHVLLATRLVSTVFFAGLATLAIVGAWHQDRKLLARRGPAYAEYLRQTSAVPFAAIVSGRQRLGWGDISVRGLAVGVVAAIAVRTVHPAIFSHDGVWVIVAVLGGAAVSGFRASRRVRRLRAASAPARSLAEDGLRPSERPA